MCFVLSLYITKLEEMSIILSQDRKLFLAQFSLTVSILIVSKGELKDWPIKILMGHP